MNPTPKPFKRPVSVLVVIHHQYQQFLLLQRSDNPLFWQSVTGSLETDETPLQTAVRELCEETGVCLSASDIDDWHLSYDYDIYPEYWYRYAPNVRTNTEHVFSVNIAPNATITIAPREHSAYQWVDADTALSMAYSPSNQQAIAALIQQGKNKVSQ
ncbi:MULTISPECIES: dihydroneopterin triphosphate diphosphatase [Vitreoscilla]|uniref:Dihydroneopterin triphosphate diphosphatase n=1 Tax=Vitreoscilla stercoraria TaxID=61 RepID=A0ABY4E876_VITST|nr:MULTISPECIES: dihydroneopterin triphosphate diphosphatase [Vitreoscilla]AUZ04638.1 NUDIX hydrolase [Vitreoscilla sp. C1]UOO91667.1 dihydroneopterin triphosphate diphosphatase [Vitreoscilla stercoraria]